MANNKNYYDILGVNRNSSQDEIKKAYRALAMKYHPDKSTGNEERFKEINEANEVLSDRTKKSKYDQQFYQASRPSYSEDDSFVKYGSSGQFDFSEMMKDPLWGNIFNQGKSKTYKSWGNASLVGEDIKITVELTLEEIAMGCTKKIKYQKREICTKCKGKGGSRMATCQPCQGTGKTSTSVNTILGSIKTNKTCVNCSGSGEAPENGFYCDSCNGKGVTLKDIEFNAKMNKGYDDGEYEKVKQRGHVHKNSGVCGDLLIFIKQLKHDKFTREDDDIFYNKNIGIITMIRGGFIEVPTVFETTLKIKLKKGTNTQVKIKNKGIVGGDMYIKLNVVYPEVFSEKENELLDELEQCENFKEENI